MDKATAQYAAFAIFNVLVAGELNSIVVEPYMDEPFHVPQAQTYCRGEWTSWDPKITTPPGLYVLSVLLKRVFLFKCTTGILRLTNVLLLISLPPLISHLLATLRRVNPPRSLLEPTFESLVISAFPITWFFSFLYYTELGSVVFVLSTLLASLKGKHWLAALTGLLSCTFRQTNIIWVLYALAFSSLVTLHRKPPQQTGLHDPPAASATPVDIFKSIVSLPRAIIPLLPTFLPYFALTLGFIAFVVWNGGIVLGDKSNHVPALHIPQLYYFLGFITLLGLPVLVTTPRGPLNLVAEVYESMYGSILRVLLTLHLASLVAITVHFFTIHHPFILSDNRHYTFYLWSKLFRRYPASSYLLVPLYIALAWAWWLRLYGSPLSTASPPPATISSSTSPSELSPTPAPARAYIPPYSTSLLQALLLPLALLPTLLPTPLLEPRYFLIPYILLRLQIDPSNANIANPSERKQRATRAIVLEGVWYALINWATMSLFLYKPREGGKDGVIRFMW